MTYQQIRKHPEVCALLQKGDDNLGILGFTEHSQAHCALVAERAAMILEELGFDAHTQELARIAGFMHDIGNAINRTHHAELGALLANDILKEMDMPIGDRMTVISAIGNHDESTGGAKDPVSAALVIADKTDVRRNRVRPQDPEDFDIHDRVNYAVEGTKLLVHKEQKMISLELRLDEQISTMYDYFQIFLGRMHMCQYAAKMLGMQFQLTVNGGKVL